MASRSKSFPPESARYYRQALRALNESGLPYLIAGASALAKYTGIHRYTKDLDLFIRRDDLPSAIDALVGPSDRTEPDYAHWLGKARRGDASIDLIFRTDNGLAEVDSSWFENARDDELLGQPVEVCPPEELIWTKAFVMERERYDGADVAHLFRFCGPHLDWERLAQRFEPHWQLLLSHLILFRFIYPSASGCIPADLLDELTDRLSREENGSHPESLCRGTLLSRAAYLPDVTRQGYMDARLQPHGELTRDEVRAWTEAAKAEGRT